MPKRNDLCFCGSGKKYKNCCALKTEVSKPQLLEEELEVVLQKFFENPLESTSDLEEFAQYEKEWTQKLNKVMSPDLIQDLVINYFLFVARQDLWKRYLLKTLNGQIRPATKDVLFSWQNPFVLFGMVTATDVDSFKVTEVLGHDTYTISKETITDIVEGELVFGIVLPDHRTFDDGVFLLSVQTLELEVSAMIRELIVTMARNSEETTSYTFYKTSMLDIYQMMYGGDHSGNQFFTEDLARDEKEVLSILEGKLQSISVSTENIEVVKKFGEVYLVKEAPNFRKPAVVSAAIVTAAVDFGILPALTGVGQKDIAKMFGVSVAAMMNHVDALEDIFFDLMLEDVEDMDAVEVYQIGTYPHAMEKEEWALFCKGKAFEDVEEVFVELMDQSFESINKEQYAQVLAYRAYEEENSQVKSQLVKEIVELDSQNVDGLLLLAEATTEKRKVEKLYEKAIRLGRMTFIPEEEAGLIVTNRPYMRAMFAYGVWLYEENRLEEATALFEKVIELDEEDPLSARYLLISAYITMNRFDRAVDLIDMYEYHSDDEAVYRYLRWILEETRTEGESVVSEQYFNEAVETNVFVLDLLEKGNPSLPYPKREEIIAGSKEEANYIWTLIGR